MTPAVARFAVRPGTAERLRAIGAARGRIVGRFDHSVSALVGEKILLHFSARPEAAHPLSITMDEAALWDLRGDADGTPVKIDWPRISIGGIRGTAREILIEPSLPATVSRDAMRKNLPRLERALRLFGRPSPVRGAVFGGAGPFSEPVRRAREALREGNLDLAELLPWIGGGEGSTPAWDDFCAGMLLADCILAGGRVLASEAFLDEAGRRTTLASEWQLRFAAEGRSCLLVERMLHALAGGDLPFALLVRAAGVGHTSGTDLLSGVWFYLSEVRA